MRAIVAPRDHPRAYQAYLKGKYHWARPGDAGLDEALLAREVLFGGDLVRARGRDRCFGLDRAGRQRGILDRRQQCSCCDLVAFLTLHRR